MQNIRGYILSVRRISRRFCGILCRYFGWIPYRATVPNYEIALHNRLRPAGRQQALVNRPLRGSPPDGVRLARHGAFQLPRESSADQQQAASQRYARTSPAIGYMLSPRRSRCCSRGVSGGSPRRCRSSCRERSRSAAWASRPSRLPHAALCSVPSRPRMKLCASTSSPA